MSSPARSASGVPDTVSSVLGQFGLSMYSVPQPAVTPLARLHLSRCASAGKENAARLAERTGIAGAAAPTGAGRLDACRPWGRKPLLLPLIAPSKSAIRTSWRPADRRLQL